MTAAATALVMAKAPVAGRVKTRLGATVGLDRAAELAAAALLDTLERCERALGPGVLALEGDLSEAVRGEEVTALLDGWDVVAQRGDGFGERLRLAHGDTLRLRPGTVVVQVGMDTPHLDPEVLRACADLVVEPTDAALGLAHDGGWWVLAHRDPALLDDLDAVPMSTDRTGAETRACLERAGARVHDVPAMADVDTEDDARTAAGTAPGSRFALAWNQEVPA